MKLELEDVRGGYGRVAVLKGVSFALAAGEVLALLGHNGAGKTSTLKAIMGLLPVRTGRIALDGAGLADREPHTIVGLGIAYVPQGRRLFPYLSVEENLRMGVLAGGSDVRVLEEVYALFPPVRERLRQRAGTLSGGQQQMVAMGRALAASPRVLLLDEPFEGLQPSLVQAILRAIGRLRESGVAVVLVEQRVDLALRVADRVVFLQNGVSAHEALPAALQRDPEPLYRYVGVRR
ncbi:MAG: ABC transporter ATP-binding protein [Betaproteobacteria bacterium]|nr:MAG: ABC transporter ATP-binding protein [Betaproteobacteria bacterium]